MIPIVFLAAPAPIQGVTVTHPPIYNVTVTHPAPVVIYQAAPRPLPFLRPQVFVIQGQCAGGQCPK